MRWHGKTQHGINELERYSKKNRRYEPVKGGCDAAAS